MPTIYWPIARQHHYLDTARTDHLRDYGNYILLGSGKLADSNTGREWQGVATEEARDVSTLSSRITLALSDDKALFIYVTYQMLIQ